MVLYTDRKVYKTRVYEISRSKSQKKNNRKSFSYSGLRQCFEVGGTGLEPATSTV